MFGLTVDALRGLRAAFAADARIEKVLIYGSRAMGNYKTGSDIDITLLGRGLTAADTIFPLRDRLDALNLPYMFDISVFADLKGDGFISHVLRRGKVLYQRELGDVAGDRVALGEVCEVRRGTPITPKTAKPGDVPVVAGGLAPSYTHNVANRPANTITVSGSGYAGFVNFYAIPIWASDCTTVNPRNPEELLPMYVYRYLQHRQQYIHDNLRHGAALQHVYARDVAKLRIPLPSPDEQKRIVAVLDEAFAGVAKATANAEAVIAHCGELKQSLLQRAFSGELARQRGNSRLCVVA